MMKLMFKHQVRVKGEAAASGEPKRLNLRLVALVVFIVVGLAAAVAYLLVEAQKRPAITIGTGQQVPARVELLQKAQLEQVADVKILSPTQDMDWAYAKATALSMLEKHNEALDVYAAMVKSDKTKYYIYVDYALTAVRAGNTQLGIDTMTKAISVLEADTSLDAHTKEATKVQLNSKLSGFKEGVV